MNDGEPQRGVTKLLGLGVLLAVALLGFSIFQQYGLKESFGLWVQGQEARIAAMPVSTEADFKEDTWMSGGIAHTTRTYRKAGQTHAEWTAEHRAAVTADLEGGFPKDP